MAACFLSTAPAQALPVSTPAPVTAADGVVQLGSIATAAASLTEALDLAGSRSPARRELLLPPRPPLCALLLLVV